LGLMALGLSQAEWRSAGRIAALAARYSVSGGRNAVGGMSNASGWLVNLVNRGPGLAPEAPEEPPPPIRPRAVVRSAERPAEPHTPMPSEALQASDIVAPP